MTTVARQANFMLPDDLLTDLKQLVGLRQQSRFVAEALRKELRREKLKNALKNSFGAWKDEDHPELQGGIEPYIQKLRKSSRAERAA